MISIKSCNPFSRSECLAITEESCSFDSNIVFEFYCLLWLFAKLIKFLDYVLFLQVQTHFLEQYRMGQGLPDQFIVIFLTRRPCVIKTKKAAFLKEHGSPHF